MNLPERETRKKPSGGAEIKERLFLPEIPPEVEEVEAVAGQEFSLPGPATDDAGQVLLDNATPQQVVITLPLTEEQMLIGLRQKVTESLRWLAEWTKRLLKIMGGRFNYQLKTSSSKS